MVIEPTDMEELKTKFEGIGVDIQAGPGKRWGSHGDGISLYIYDPDDYVVQLGLLLTSGKDSPERVHH